ncbi:MAG: right-handed parallel beta-helix repeat-containing protein [Candidatus Helarchaeota archaeon]
MNRNILKIIFINLLFLVSFIGFIYIKNVKTNYESIPSIITISTTKSINITSNTDFTKYASSGNGLSTDPYVIENLIIEANLPGPSKTFSININNTNAFFIIRNCTTIQGYYGIWLNNVSNGVIERNNFSISTHIPVHLTNSSYINITDNIMMNEKSYGIELYNSSFNLIYNNSIFNTNYDAIRLWNNSNWNKIDKNKIGHCALGPFPGFGILVVNSGHNNITNNLINDIHGDGIDLQNSNYNKIENNSIENVKKDLYTYGITLINSSFILIQNCTIENSSNGIQLADNSDNTTIILNNIINNYFGIYLGHSDNITINNNTIFKNSFTGLYIEWVNFSDIRYNIINNNSNDGIFIQRSYNNTICLNNVSFNLGYGLEILNLAQNNTITFNWFIYNKYPSIYPTDANVTNIIKNNTIIHKIPPIQTTTTEQIPGLLFYTVISSLVLMGVMLFFKKYRKMKTNYMF